MIFKTWEIIQSITKFQKGRIKINGSSGKKIGNYNNNKVGKEKNHQKMSKSKKNGKI